MADEEREVELDTGNFEEMTILMLQNIQERLDELEE